MQQIKITVEIPRAIAIQKGLAQAGETEYVLTPSDLVSLTDEERTEVAAVSYMEKLRHYTDRVTICGPPTWEHVLAGLRARIAIRAAKAAEETANRESNIQAALAASDENWIDSWDVVFPNGPIGIYLDEAARHDLRIVARIAEVEAIVAPRRAAREAEKAREEAEQAEAKASAEAAKAAATTALMALATQEPELARAAIEGYPVAKAMVKRLATRLQEEVAGYPCTTALDDSLYNREALHKRAAPSSETFGLLDHVRSVADTANTMLADAIGRWDVSPIYSIDVCPHKEYHHRVTAVLCTLRTPIGDWELTCSLESLECEHEVVEDDE